MKMYRWTVVILVGIGAIAAEPQRVFEQGQDGVHTYRIPAIARTPKGTLLAFCEARKGGTSDAGDIDLVLRRSLDNGKTWLGIQTLVDDGTNTCGNPCPIVDRTSGLIVLLITKNIGSENEHQIMTGDAAPRTVWILTSEDDGANWSAPRDITAQASKPSWRWYATGPGHGIQLASGRMVAPCDHSTGPKPEEMHSHVIYSDDLGATWAIGGDVEGRTDESTVVALADNSLYLNMRNRRDSHCRASAVSLDHGATWSAVKQETSLIEPECQASILAIQGGATSQYVVFSNPSSTRRENMTIRTSTDACKSWTSGVSIWTGPAAYSDLVELPDRNVGCLFECGVKNPYEGISFVAIQSRMLDDNGGK